MASRHFQPRFVWKNRLKRLILAVIFRGSVHLLIPLYAGRGSSLA